MRITQEQLADNLSRTKKQASSPLFIVSGDEPLLRQESCDQIRQFARDNEFTERLTFHAGKNFDWAQISEETESLSLFAERKLVEINLESLPNSQAKSVFKIWQERVPEECIILIISNRFEASTLKSKWFQNLEKVCIHVQIWPIEPIKLPSWISGRFSRAGFKPTTAAVKALAEHVKGNLLAAHQEIEKLRLLLEGSEIDEHDILQSVADSSRYSVFSLIDACLAQNVRHTVKILHGLQLEGFEAAIVLWGLAREARLLAKLARQLQQRKPLEDLLKKERVMKKRWGLYKNFLTQNIDRESRQTRLLAVRSAHTYCRLADQALKGTSKESPWLYLQQAALEIAGLHQRRNI